MGPLIRDYTFELSEPACAPGSGRYGIRIVLPDDISAVFPYLNTVMQDTWYDHENKVLIGADNGTRYAFRSSEIRVAGISDVSQAGGIVHQAVEMVNRIWGQRDSIKPRFAERKLPTVIDIFKLLPKTNCRRCGYQTCLVFAAEMRSGKAMLEQCPPLSQPENSARKESIQRLFQSD